MTPHTLRSRSRTLFLLGSVPLLAIGVSATTLATVPTSPSHAAVPPYFSTDGKQTTNFGSGADSGAAVAVQPDGKAVVVGTVAGEENDDIGLTRYNRDGSLDTALGGGGGTYQLDSGGDDVGNAVALQEDGKIVVTGRSSSGNLMLARFNADGTIDSSFGGGGLTIIDYQGPYASGNAVAIQTDGKIVVGGTFDRGTGAGNQYTVARYTSDGQQDFTFGGDGTRRTDMGGGSGNSVALQSDDKIVLAGSTGSAGFGVVRYTSDGAIDTTFSGDGTQTTELVDGDDEGRAVAVQSDGRIVVAGTASSEGLTRGFAVARYASDGTLDNTFSGDGKQVTGSDSTGGLIGNALAVQAGGKLVVAGGTSSGGHFKFALARFTTQGALDSTFSGDGLQTTEFEPFALAYGAAAGPDGKITVAGETYANDGDFAVARYISNGSLDAVPTSPPPTTNPEPRPTPEPTPGSSRACTITGTGHRDVIRGTSGRDVICARGGADLVYGLGGNDLIFGHRGNDRLIGGSGNDRIHGQRGRDRLNGEKGRDILRGGPRRDRLFTRDGVRGNDTARGGAAKDKCLTNRRDLRIHC
jgi:uncharacterized delta-60 repeat protein